MPSHTFSGSISTYPRKGTETHCRPSCRPSRRNFNLSPQGDGNPVRDVLSSTSQQISTYPRKGTETTLPVHQSRTHQISTYPRKGTETLFGMFSHPLLNRFQLIPARGRKQHCPCINPVHTRFQLIPARGRKRCRAKRHNQAIQISTYPRKGTETVVGNLDSVTGIFQLIPARGRKLLSAIVLIKSAVYFNLSPQGDGNASSMTGYFGVVVPSP